MCWQLRPNAPDQRTNEQKTRLYRKPCSANTCRRIISPSHGRFRCTAGTLLLNQIFPNHQNFCSSASQACSYWQPENHPESLTWLPDAPRALVRRLQERVASQARSPAGLACALPAPAFPTALLEKFPRNPNELLSLSVPLRDAFISRFAEMGAGGSNSKERSCHRPTFSFPPWWWQRDDPYLSVTNRVKHNLNLTSF